jgi:hypothetical protein
MDIKTGPKNRHNNWSQKTDIHVITGLTDIITGPTDMITGHTNRHNNWSQNSHSNWNNKQT